MTFRYSTSAGGMRTQTTGAEPSSKPLQSNRQISSTACRAQLRATDQTYITYDKQLKRHETSTTNHCLNNTSPMQIPQQQQQTRSSSPSQITTWVQCFSKRTFTRFGTSRTGFTSRKTQSLATGWPLRIIIQMS